MDNLKYKITLKAIKDIDGFKKDEIVCLLINGIVTKDIITIFNIRDFFKILSYQLFTGLKDINKVDIFEKDGITTKFSRLYSSDSEYFVKFIDGTFVLVDNYDNPSEHHHLYDNVNFEYEVTNETN